MAYTTLASGAPLWVPHIGWYPRVVAVDEDGTFLQEHTHYNEERFEALWPKMAAAGVRFVVATGNQYWQVRDLFANHANEIAYVTANGGYVEDIGGKPLFAAEADAAAVQTIIREIHQNPELPFLMAGLHGAYVEYGVAESFVNDMSTYCHRLYRVENLSEVDDQVIMFSTVTEVGAVRQWMSHFAQICNAKLDVVYSGEGYFDLVVPGVNKASGVAALCKRWNIAATEVAAFGDSENDLELLSWAGAGYAMANADESVRLATRGIAPANTEDGVLQVLEAWFCT